MNKSESCTEEPGLGAAGLPRRQLHRPADKSPLLYWPNTKQEEKPLT